MEAKRIRIASILLGMAVALSLMPGFAIAASADTGDLSVARSDELQTASSKPLQAIQANRLNVFESDTGKNLDARVVEGNGELRYAVKSGGDCVIVDSNGALTFNKAGTATITVTAAETNEYAETSIDVPITIYDHFDYTFTVGNTLDCVDYYGHYPINKVVIKLKNGNTVVGSATINSPKIGSSATISATGFANKIEMTAEIQQRKNTRSASETLNLNGGGRFEIEMNSRGTIVLCDYGITLPEPDFTAPVAKRNLTATGNNQLLIYPGSVLSGGQHMEYTFGTKDAPNNNEWTDNYGFMRAKDPGDYYVWWKTASRDRRSLMYFSGGRLDTAPQCVKVTIGKGSINPTVSIDGWTYGETAKAPTVSGNTGNGEVTYKYKVRDADDSTYTTTAPENAGDYTVRANIADSTTHYGGSATKDFTITKATLPPQNVRVVGVMNSNDAAYAWVGNFTQSLAGMMPAKAGALTYQAGTPTFKDGKTTKPEGVESFTSSVNSSTGNVTAELKISSNATAIPENAQEITLPVTVTSGNYNNAVINVVMAPKARTPMTVILSNPPASVVYGNGPFALKATVKDEQGEDVETQAGDWYWYSSDPNVLEVANTGSNEMPIKVKNPGSAMIMAWYEPNGGNTIGAAITNPITVNKASIDARVSIDGWTYGEAAKAPSVSGVPEDASNDIQNNSALTVSYEYKVKDADDSTYTTTAPKLAGEYTVRATVPETTYYKGATPTVSFAIAKKQITAYVTAPDKTYDGTTDATVSATVDKGALVQSDLDDAALVDDYGKVTISGLVGTFKDANAGKDKEIILNYDGVVSPVANAESYEVTATTYTPTASIEKRTVYVGADDKSSPYGEDIVELTYGLYGPDGLVEGDSLESLSITASTTATSRSDVGEYPIELSGGTGNDNYEVIFCEEEDTYTKYTITAADISQAKVELSRASYTYDGKAKKPTATVTLGSRTLAAGTDYDVSYANNTEIGTATVTLTGKGNYIGSATANFSIQPGETKLTTVARPGAKSVQAKWKKVPGAKKYQVQWRERGGKWKSKTVKAAKTTVKGLKRGKLYDFRVRAVAGEAKGEWSAQGRRWLVAPSGVKAASSKAGTVKVTWKKTSKANAGYKVVVRYSKAGKAVATKTVKAKRTSATVKGLASGKRAYVEVLPLRKAGGATYTGALARAKSPAKVAG